MKKLKMLNQIFKYIFLEQPYEKWLFLISFLFGFLFLYRIITIRQRGRRPVQLTYVFSLVFTLSTIFLTIKYYHSNVSFLIFLLAGLTYWIIYFGYTPRWSPHFVMTFIFGFIPIFIANYIVSIESIQLFSLDGELSSSLSFLNIPLELFYLEFFLGFVGVLVFEFIKKQKST